MDETTTEPADDSSVSSGLGIIWLCNSLQLIGSIAVSDTSLGHPLLKYFTLIQLVYGAAFVYSAKKKAEHERAKGMIIAICLTTLITGTCTAALFWG